MAYLKVKESLRGAENKSADKVKRKDCTWGGNLKEEFTSDDKFERLQCRACGKTNAFEILQTSDYETSAKCVCGMYYIVHSG